MRILFTVLCGGLWLILGAAPILPMPSDWHAPHALAHDFHMSKGQIEYAPAEQSLQITLHFFIDDMEEALRRNGADKLFLGSERETAQAEEQLISYLRRHLAITLDGKPVNARFLGKETSNDYAGLWCYLVVEDIEEAPRQISIRYDLLQEVFGDQKNIINVLGPGGKRVTLLFEKDNALQKAQF
jgi:hypothetical protein